MTATSSTPGYSNDRVDLINQVGRKLMNFEDYLIFDESTILALFDNMLPIRNVL